MKNFICLLAMIILTMVIFKSNNVQITKVKKIMNCLDFNVEKFRCDNWEAE
jgi:hypothetical protein